MWRRSGRGGGRGRNQGPWPGQGPFSHLPPWQRPGWLYGPGSCWYFYQQGENALQNQESPIPPPLYPRLQFCTECNALVAPNANYCAQCGRKVETPFRDNLK
ncbi:MAG: zinc-ribbon domain-containing protein [Candidatus Thorarchaeota archaeon]